MKKEAVQSRAIYPARGYSHAVRTGPIVWTAGIVAQDAEGNIVGRGDIAVQTEQVFQNVKTVLESMGLGMEDVVKITIFATSVLFRPVIMAARSKYFQADPPASTFFVVSSLSTPDQLVEMEVVAVTDGQPGRVE
jgi:enamine deaminase RidA (YjgF/YER057c/UK114 family)